MAYLDPRGVRVAGVMTGTSCDGLDVACVEFAGHGARVRWQPVWSASAPYPAALRKRVLAAQLPGQRLSIHDWLELHHDLGRWYASTLARVLSSRAPRPHLVANHGQTIAHFPDEGLTLQLGDPSILAKTTRLSVATTFREGDLAARGQGAPLVPRFHSLLARRLGAPKRALAIHNLGGISNLSYFGAHGSGKGAPAPQLAFDTGPGNLWIDAAAALATRGRQAMDRDGRLAAAGEPDAQAVRAILRHPFFKERAPKSTGRGEFAFELLRSATRAKGADLVATATSVTIESIALAYENEILRKRLRLQDIFFCGGGANNPTIVEGVRRRLAGIRVRSIREAGLDPQLIEAQAFAYCGYLALLGEPVGGGWTGARGFGPPAHLIPGENWAELASKLRGTRSHR